MHCKVDAEKNRINIINKDSKNWRLPVHSSEGQNSLQ